jgi:peptide/nickel transport system permease protein
MQRYILTRILYACVSLILLSITIFYLVRITGDPAILMAEPGAKEEDLQAIRREFGLDKTMVVQYYVFVKNLLRGDFGKSIYYRTPAFELYMQRLPSSMLLALVAMAISLILGIPIGILSAVRLNTWFDNFGKIFAILGLSLPSFWVGLMLILTLSVYLGWLPSSGAGGWKHIIMPSFSLGWVFAAAHMRLARSAMLEVLGSEYVKLARIKGLSEQMVIAKHAFKNAVIPVLTLAGLNLGQMVNVAVVVESVFAWPGVGRLLYEGVSFRDFPIVQTTVLLGGVLVVALSLIVDIMYAYIDPRIRYGN